MSAPRVSLLRLCRAEWFKIRGRGLAAAVLLLASLHGLAAVAVLYGVQAMNNDATKVPQDFFSVLPALRLSLQLVGLPLNAFAVLLLAALLWAEDFSLGTLAMVFVRPVRRARIFLAKLLVALGITLGTQVAALLVGGVVGVLFFGFGSDVELARAPMMAQALMSEEPTGAQLMGVVAGMGRGLLLLSAPLALTSLLASLTRSPVLTLFGTLFVIAADGTLSLVLKAWAGLRLSGGELARDVVQWTLTQSSWNFASQSSVLVDPNALGGPAMGWQPPTTLAVYTLLFYGAALWLFVKRDVT